MSKTTVFIDETLMRNALKATKLKTKKDVLEAGLKELIRKTNREMMRKDLGTFDIEISIEELQKLRSDK